MKETTRIATVEITHITKCNNLLSKEESVKKLKEVIREATGADCVKVTNIRDFVMEKDEAEQKESGWIPCSERLPECDDYAETNALLFQTKVGSIEVGYFGRKNAWRDAYFRHYRTACGFDVSDVIAWQPLPEPYKPEAANWKDAMMQHFVKGD